jgi:hypothetical protein
MYLNLLISLDIIVVSLHRKTVEESKRCVLLWSDELFVDSLEKVSWSGDLPS